MSSKNKDFLANVQKLLAEVEEKGSPSAATLSLIVPKKKVRLPSQKNIAADRIKKLEEYQQKLVRQDGDYLSPTRRRAAYLAANKILGIESDNYVAIEYAKMMADHEKNSPAK